MYTRIYFIALVPNSYEESEKYTMYFVQKEQKYLLPAEISQKQAETLFDAGKSPKTYEPDIYDTTKRLLAGLHAQMISITVYKSLKGTFYVYLNINHDKDALELNVSFTDAVILAQKFDVPIFIKKRILETKGIQVSEKLIKEALFED